MKTVGFCHLFIADMNSACKNMLVVIFEFPYKAKFRLILSKALPRLNSCKNYTKMNDFLVVCIFVCIEFPSKAQLLKSFSENLKQLTKMNDFL